MRNRRRIDYINARDINDLDENECLFINLISVIFIRILDIRIELYGILRKESVRIVFRSEDVLQLASFPCEQ